jgi:L-ascorbate metabolism protein UlaG (beta-lactamase superfamily)
LDITWYGHSCFRISERGQIAVITDPYSDQIGLPPLKLKGDIVTISHDRPGHNNSDAVKGANYVLNGPGEYEIGGVFITGIAMHFVNEQVVHHNIAYLIQYGSLTVLHLGDLMHVPEQSTIEAIESMGAVNVALVPVGGGHSLRAPLAAEVIALFEPNYIIPMHYALPGLAVELDPVDKFLKEMGVSKVQEEDILKVSSGSLPEQPQVVVLRPQT